MTSPRPVETSRPQGMKIGVVGCGWAFELYMGGWDRHPQLEIAGIADVDPTRLGVVGRHYGLRCYASNEALFADPEVDVVANFTPPPSHYSVTKAALEAGKHVYSEKPLTTDLAQARELLELAEANGLHLSCAPSNVLGDTAQTMWKAIEDGAVGDARLVYAELDSNPLYLMRPELARSPTGAPWPWLHELEMGCTWEHAGYCLSWMCAMFGPVKSVTAFSKRTLPDKTDQPLDPPDTPDFSVACLDFHSGVVGRLTCSIGAPYDHRLRVIGNQGMIMADTYRHYRCPVYLERFTRLPLKGRLLATVRNSTPLQRLFGVGGRRLDLVRNPSPGTDRIVDPAGPWWRPMTWRDRFWKRQEGWQDKCLGIAELADAIRSGRRPFPAHDFTYHVTELTLAIGEGGGTRLLESSFQPPALREGTRNHAPDYRRAMRPPLLERLVWGVLDRVRKASARPPRPRAARPARRRPSGAGAARDGAAPRR